MVEKYTNFRFGECVVIKQTYKKLRCCPKSMAVHTSGYGDRDYVELWTFSHKEGEGAWLCFGNMSVQQVLNRTMARLFPPLMKVYDMST